MANIHGSSSGNAVRADSQSSSVIDDISIGLGFGDLSSYHDSVSELFQDVDGTRGDYQATVGLEAVQFPGTTDQSNAFVHFDTLIHFGLDSQRMSHSYQEHELLPVSEWNPLTQLDHGTAASSSSSPVFLQGHIQQHYNERFHTVLQGNLSIITSPEYSQSTGSYDNPYHFASTEPHEPSLSSATTMASFSDADIPRCLQALEQNPVNLPRLEIPIQHHDTSCQPVHGSPQTVDGQYLSPVTQPWQTSPIYQSVFSPGTPTSPIPRFSNVDSPTEPLGNPGVSSRYNIPNPISGWFSQDDGYPEQRDTGSALSQVIEQQDSVDEPQVPLSDDIVSDWFKDEPRTFHQPNPKNPAQRHGSMRGTKHTRSAASSYSCTHCDKEFKQRSKLNHHARCHRPGPYKCEECDQQFSYPKDLKRHEKVHSGDRPFLCEFARCGQTFTREDHRRRHYKSSVHRSDMPVMSRSHSTACIATTAH